MLTSVAFENFRCLRNVELRLGPLTVLVGPNASGKSAVLAALEPSYRPELPADAWRHDASLRVARRIRRDDGEPIEQVGPDGWKAAGLPPYALVRLDPAALRKPSASTSQARLQSDGGNAAGLFASLGPEERAEVAAELRSIVPVFAGLDVRPARAGGGAVELWFEDRWQRGVWYAADEVSDGTLVALGYVLLAHQADPVALLAIEQPARGLHPYALGEVVTMLRGLGAGKIGKRPIQIVAATHSAELLDYLSPEEVRFFTRSTDDGAVQVVEAQPDASEWAHARRTYPQSLGSVWLSGVGGVPA